MKPLLSRLAIAAALAPASLALLGPTAASAAYEQVGCFAGTFPGLTDSCKPIDTEKETFGEEVQLGGVGGMAVNYTGNGGVPAGTVYAASYFDSLQIAMYVPKPGGGLEFKLRWQVPQLIEPYARCGPSLPEQCSPQVNKPEEYVDVDVDQGTGNVYAFNGKILVAGRSMIVEYTPDGSDEITRFGERAPPSTKTAETPDQIHECCGGVGRIAVNGSGEVYVYDQNYFDSGNHRLMKFRPKTPGKFDEYEYAGMGEDLGAGFSGQGREPRMPVADAAGNIYVSDEKTHIEMYDPAKPGEPPVCDFEFTKGGITAITVDPTTGEVFFFSIKFPKRVRRLGPCDPQTGKFTELEPEPEALKVAPERYALYALAFDPVRQVDPQRPPGILYGSTPASSDGQGSGEPGQSSLGYIFAHSKEVPPEVKSQSVTHITASGALLHAVIDSHGFNTEYAFQYIALAQYEANPPEDRFAGALEAPSGGATIPAAQGGQNVSMAIAGLAPGTDYRFRVFAVSHCSPSELEKECEDAGSAGSFRTFRIEAPGLPDNRAYELVSPAQKNGGQVLPVDPFITSCGECKPGRNYDQFPRQSAPDGDAIVYEGTPFFGSDGALIQNEYISHRDGNTGWQTTNLSPPQGGSYRAFDTELNQGVLKYDGATPLSPKAPPGYENLYAQPTADPLALRPLLTTQPPNRPEGGGESTRFNLTYAGASADLSRVFFRANDGLTAETPFAPAATDGGTGKFNLYEWQGASGDLALVNVAPGNAASEPGASFGDANAHAISADGSRVFWSDEAGQLYVRENAEVTREIPGPGIFLSASTDGSKVLLTSGQLYDLEGETTTDLTEGKGSFEGIAGQSDNLSRIYFVDTAVLDETPNAEGDEAEAGKHNLYAWEEGTTRYVATLVARDNDGANIAHSRSWWPFPALRTAQASPNGRFLGFLSEAQLTGYANDGPCGGGKTTPCPQVFLYDAQTDELICPSCNPSETTPLGWSVLRTGQFHYLTNEGRLFFDSQDSLSVFDTNEGIEDVYEYEPNEVGTCKRPDGCVSLISPGNGSSDSNLVTIDEDGGNVFFTTRDQLTLPDKDELIDLYDAREDGGIASEAAKPDSECQGEACQPAAIVPNDPTPASASFEGEGNVNKQGKTKPRCPKGRRQVKRKGKTHCAKRSAKRHSARAAGGKRGGAK